MTSRWLVAAMVVWSAAAWAHKGSDAYWRLEANGAELTGRLDLAFQDLTGLVHLDADGDGTLRWGEVRREEARLREVVLEGVGLSQDGTTCPLDLNDFAVAHHSDGAYLSMALRARCPRPVIDVSVHYGLLFDLDAQHRGLVLAQGASGTHWQAFTRERQTQVVSLSSVSAVAQAREAFQQGAHHLAVGWDHLCFLAALLLPSVLRRETRVWAARASLGSALKDVARVVTAFTVAHSLTLGLAAFGWASPHARAVEVAIALSVAVAAFNNLVPLVSDTRWSLAFTLGLLHGFGFVSAMADLGTSRLWLSVVSFNLGVEAGQVALVALFVPLAWLVRTRTFYQRAVMPLASAAILVLALVWTGQRLLS